MDWNTLKMHFRGKRDIPCARLRFLSPVFLIVKSWFFFILGTLINLFHFPFLGKETHLKEWNITVNNTCEVDYLPFNNSGNSLHITDHWMNNRTGAAWLKSVRSEAMLSYLQSPQPYWYSLANYYYVRFCILITFTNSCLNGHKSRGLLSDSVFFNAMAVVIQWLGHL